jgi:hypothetical protein
MDESGTVRRVQVEWNELMSRDPDGPWLKLVGCAEPERHAAQPETCPALRCCVTFVTFHKG